MLKRILIITGIFIMGIAAFSLPLEADTAVINKKEQKSLFTKEQKISFSTFNTVTEKIHAKYEDLEFGVSSNSEKELRVQVQENEEYFNSVKKDIESIAKSVIISSALKDYTVVVERLDLSFINKKVENINKELVHLTTTLVEGLKDYDVFGNLNAEYQKSITIHTSIKGSDKNADELAREIEETLNEILYSEELNNVSNIDSYEIKILNTNGEVVN